MGLDSAKQTSSLAPGFRFHPTDEELVRYYLRRKVCGKPFRFDAISEIDVYKSEPWDLPDMSRLKSRDLEWYFFSVLDKKYDNGSKTNRATEKGYWKTTGKDRAVLHRSRTVGMKKTLVFHIGRAPRGQRSNWVMHEYRLVDEDLESNGIAQDAFVLCRIFQKSGSGPKNGEQYGAPFVEEEWEDDELVMVPGKGVAEEVLVGDDDYLDGNALEQILEANITSEDVPLPLNIYQEHNSAEDSTDFADDAQKPFMGVDENHFWPEQPDEQKLFDMPVQYNLEAIPVKHEYIGETSNAMNPVDADYLLDEPFMDASDNPPFSDGAFLETNDLSNSTEADSSSFDMLDEYLVFFDADGDNSHYMASNCSVMMGDDNLVPDQVSVTQKHLTEETPQVAVTNQEHSNKHDNDVASSSKPEPPEFGSDTQYPFLQQASRMLGSISAPPAFASEFPTKDSDLWLNSAFASEFPTKDSTLRMDYASQSSSSIHVTAGMIRVRNMTISARDCSFGKYGNINIVLYFDLSRSDVNTDDLEPTSSALPSKVGSAMSRGLFYFMFIWVLILSMSFKIGTSIFSGNAS